MIRIRKIVENGKIDGENTHGSTPDGRVGTIQGMLENDVQPNLSPISVGKHKNRLYDANQNRPIGINALSTQLK
jgi:hypothetical protein